MQAAGDGRSYVEKPPEEEPPTFLQERPTNNKQAEIHSPTGSHIIYYIILYYIREYDALKVAIFSYFLLFFLHVLCILRCNLLETRWLGEEDKRNGDTTSFLEEPCSQPNLK